MKYNNYYKQSKTASRTVNQIFKTLGIKNTSFGKIVLGIVALIVFGLSVYSYVEFSSVVNQSETNPSPEVLSEIKENNTAKVVRIVDGDTFEIEYDNQTFKVRLIGIDTPETVHPEKSVQCFGEEAKSKTKELLENKEIYFNFDNSQGETDRYRRLLLYVWRADDDLFINEYLLSEGYAHLYETTPPFHFRDRFYNLEQGAMTARRGLWGDSCN